MIYRIKLKKKAEKFLDSRTQKERTQLLSAINKLPKGTDIHKMEGYSNRYRLRVGNVRVIYDVFDDELIVLVLNAGNRGDVYK